MLLSPCDAATLEAIAHRVRADIEHGSAACGERVTVTIGACLAEPGETLGVVLQHADDALYRAKDAGRNQVVIAAR